MAAYLIARNDVTELETVIFDGDGVAVFTDPGNAESYIREAGWEDQYTVAALDSVDFLEWLILNFRNGVKHMVTDPDRKAHEQGRLLDTLDIEAQLEQAGNKILLIANPDF